MGWPTGIKRLALAAAGAPLAAAMTTVMLASPSAAAPQPARAALEVQASSHVYSTLIGGLHVRKAPTTAAPILAVLGPAGTKVSVDCWARGSSVFGDSIWSDDPTFHGSHSDWVIDTRLVLETLRATGCL